ncbi:hypothetical protein F8388_018021 [Cannabis sativa]|uniref:Uncharacterized protein n=1 Tax=Cannabis sativa TaxID=3483 RepID=A0A7J6E8S0_CANSA|nr:hypothetical protein F8388_018021 [Cannabis sativa]
MRGKERAEETGTWREIEKAEMRGPTETEWRRDLKVWCIGEGESPEYHWFSRFLARTLQTLNILIKSDINSNSAVDHDGLLFLHDRHHFHFPAHSRGTTQSQYSKSQLIAILVNIIWQSGRTQPNNDIINSFGGHGFGLALRNDNLCYGGSTVGEVEGGGFELVGPEIGVLDPNLG